MKAIHLTATMGTITAKKDRSLGFRLNTPELTEAEKAAFMELQPEVLEVFIKPLDTQAPEMSIKAEKDEKTPSQRLRNTMYALYMSKKEAGEFIPDTFQEYYNTIMEKLIESYKDKLGEYDGS